MNSIGKIQRISVEDFPNFFKIMEKSFPSIERRTYEEQLSLLEDENYKIIGLKDNQNKVLAFIAMWQFEDFNFIEHFAVDDTLRGHGMGTYILNECLKIMGDKKVILEVELPEDDICKRRIGFYKRCGFSFNSYNYLQPSLQEGYPLLPLRIMSYPEILNETDFYKFRDVVYKKVYKANLSEVEFA